MEKKQARPILWIGGTGLPGGAAGRKLGALGNPIHWEPFSEKAAEAVASVLPVLIVVDSERMTAAVRSLLTALDELRGTIDSVVFWLRPRETKRIPESVDGVLIKGPGLLLQIKTILQTMEGTTAFKAAGLNAQRQLRRTKSEMHRLNELVVRDDLTSLYNLRFFNRSLETEHQRATRFGRSYSLIFMDLDGLREINSRRGHLVGGQVLKYVGDFLNLRIRRIDLPARIGGDEFVVICPETGKVAARLVAERLREGIQRLRDPQGHLLGVSASMGVASFPDDGDLPDEVLKRADRALYEAKAQGKNRVCCWGEFAPDDVDEDGFQESVHTPMIPPPTVTLDSDDDELDDGDAPDLTHPSTRVN